MTDQAAAASVPEQDARWDAGTLDSGRPDAPNLSTLTDAEIPRVTQNDAGRGDPVTPLTDAGVTKVPPNDAGHPRDAGHVDAGGSDPAPKDAGVVIEPTPDAGSEPCDHTMLPGERRGVGEYLCSHNRQYRFGLSLEGSLELRSNAGVIWSAGNCCGVSLAMQRDGNLVVYDAGGLPVFATNTRGKDGAFLAVEDDARAVLWLGSKVVWSTATP